jgi:hypothetical protein
MDYEDYKQLSKDIKATEKIVIRANYVMGNSNALVKETRALAKALNHLTKIKHTLDRQLYIEHAPPAPWDSHDLFF